MYIYIYGCIKIIGGHFGVYILLLVVSHAYPCWGQEGLFGPAFVAGHVSGLLTICQIDLAG